MFRFFLLLIFSFSLSNNYKAQDIDANFDEDDWIKIDEWDWGWDSKPLMELNYGISNFGHKRFAGGLAKQGLAELKLGYANIDHEDESFLIDYHAQYFYVSNFSQDLISNKASSTEFAVDTWRLGIGWEDGYGYKFSNVAIIPYKENNIAWTQYKFADFPSAQNDLLIAERFNDAFRFGTTTAGGLKINIGEAISLNGSFEGATVFPRHMVWYHAASAILEGIGTGILDQFVGEVKDNAPAAAPLINFLLKNGLSYGFYLLRKEDMNWPISTETPMTMETIKFGVTFTF